jgi:hypothetical protein
LHEALLSLLTLRRRDEAKIIDAVGRPAWNSVRSPLA